MGREKIERKPEFREVEYDAKHWELLKKLRNEAKHIMKKLAERGFYTVIHGSIARGDVNEKSDIDIFIPYTIPSYKLERALEEQGFKYYSRTIIMATPQSTPKVYYSLDPDERINVSYPLAKLKPREIEFYRFGGLLELHELEKDIRKPGVNKKLVLIIPTAKGHLEMPVVGFESFAARILGISIETVEERIRVLTRRDEHGRTGVFLKLEIPHSASIEEVLEEEAAANQYLREALDNQF
ncbi:nucleotidyltransferase domain-containing protein [Thermogladius sp. 4427co]|uniref:nucleotidyltransferase domain-containing protein n=1 Tax=Thermogladius sp. 4427co TaxID=3450718 RepID=UPI003F79A979